MTTHARQTHGIKVRKRTARVKGKDYVYWLVDAGVVDGKRQTKQFATESEANRHAAAKRKERRHHADRAFMLSDNQRADAVVALSILDGSFAGDDKSFPTRTLRAAAWAYVSMTNPEKGGRKVSDLVADYIAESESHDLRPKSRETIQNRLTVFADSFGDKAVASVACEDVEKWIAHRKYRNKAIGQRTRNHYTKLIRDLFKLAVERGYIEVSPVEPKVKRRRNRMVVRDAMPEILPVADVERVIRTAYSTGSPMFAPLCLMFFGGIRQEEIKRMEWDRHVNLESGLITITPDIAKKWQVRNVASGPTLAAWLKLCANRTGYVAPQGTRWRSQFDIVRRDAKLLGRDDDGRSLWPHNCARHTFATHLYGSTNDAALVRSQLGHQDRGETFFGHYRGMAKPGDAAKFWAITPKDTKVIQLTA